MEHNLYHLLKEYNKQLGIVLVSHDIGAVSNQVKNIACVNHTLHYHASHQITEELLSNYDCPIELITHGRLPHRVLKNHGEKSC